MSNEKNENSYKGRTEAKPKTVLSTWRKLSYRKKVKLVETMSWVELYQPTSCHVIMDPEWMKR